MTMKKLLLAGGAAALMMGSTAYASIIDRPYFKVLGVVVVWGADTADGAPGAPVASDFVLLTPATGTAGADLIAADGATVVTGSLDPISSTGVNPVSGDPITGTGAGGYADGGTTGILDAGDTLAAFDVDATTDVTGLGNSTHLSSFYVASNAAFDIFAQSTAATVTGDFVGTLDETDINYSMVVNAVGGNDGTAPDNLVWGASAQDPSTGGTGVVPVANLGLMGTPTKVFDGGRKTAASNGSLAAQSVRFDNTYTLGAGGAYDLSMGAGTIYADVTYTVYVP